MTCACGVEAWVRKEKGKKPILYNFRSDPSLPFVQVKQSEGDEE